MRVRAEPKEAQAVEDRQPVGGESPVLVQLPLPAAAGRALLSPAIGGRGGRRAAPTETHAGRRDRGALNGIASGQTGRPKSRPESSPTPDAHRLHFEIDEGRLFKEPAPRPSRGRRARIARRHPRGRRLGGGAASLPGEGPARGSLPLGSRAALLPGSRAALRRSRPLTARGREPQQPARGGRKDRSGPREGL